MGYKPWCHGGQMLKYEWLTTWRFDMCHVCIQVRINFRASRVLVTLLFETSLYIITNFKLHCLLMCIMENYLIKYPQISWRQTYHALFYLICNA
jgi:hypothetical protein